jgi:predicted  nucleic acid-binding Zn-ribbon protein
VAAQSAAEAKKALDSRITDLAAREKNLQAELEQASKARAEAFATVDEATRAKYERLLRNKGSTVIVGINHGVCGGCHRQLSRAIVVSCQGDQEIVSCPNCNRILYWTPDMDMAVAN